jgi:hypothetical protein
LTFSGYCVDAYVQLRSGPCAVKSCSRKLPRLPDGYRRPLPKPRLFDFASLSTLSRHRASNAVQRDGFVFVKQILMYP